MLFMSTIEKKDVEKLATLARITIPEAQIEKVRKDIGAILDYVAQINEAHDIAGDKGGKADRLDNLNGSDSQNDFSQSYNSGVKNVMREDGEPHEPGKFTAILLKAAPKTEDGYIKVKKILG